MNRLNISNKKEKVAPAKEPMEKIVKFIHEGDPQ